MNIVYEGFFIKNNEKLNSIIKELRNTHKTKALKNTPTDFHVTTEFLPKNLHKELYGVTVKIKIRKYKLCKTLKTKKGVTANEGVSVEIITQDKNIKKLLSSINKNWHITASFDDGAKYTNDIDFTDGYECEYEVEAVFGGYDNEEKRILASH